MPKASLLFFLNIVIRVYESRCCVVMKQSTCLVSKQGNRGMIRYFRFLSCSCKVITSTSTLALKKAFLCVSDFSVHLDVKVPSRKELERTLGRLNALVNLCIKTGAG